MSPLSDDLSLGRVCGAEVGVHLAQRLASKLPARGDFPRTSNKATIGKWNAPMSLPASGRETTISYPDDYDQFQASVPHYAELQARVGQLVGAEAVRRERPMTIVEAGTGTGATTLSILSAHPQVRVVSVDVDDKMLRQAEQRLRPYKDRVEFVHADIFSYLRQLAPNHQFDGFVSAYTLHNLEPAHLTTLIPEIAHALRADAIYVNADKIARDDQSLHSRDLNEQIDAFRVYDGLGRPELREYWTDHYLTDDAQKITESDHLRALRNAGFRDAEIVWRERMEAMVRAKRTSVARVD